MKNIYIILAAIGLANILAGCSEDFLNKPPQDAMVDANFYKSDDQVLAGSADLYSAAWKDYADQANWKVGDVRAGLVFSPWATSADIRDFTTFNVTGLSANNLNAYRSFYQVIGQANTVIHNINLYATSAVSAKIKNHAIAEARFMRATAYAYLAMNYGAVPIIDDNTKYLNNAALKRNTEESVWEFIKKDYRFAAQNLAEQAPLEGRLTKWSAEGMLARTYLTVAGFKGSLNTAYLDSAKYYSDRVITMSGKKLLTSYADLFKFPYDNNSESLFELEWVYTSNANLSYKYANTMVSQITPDNAIAANGDGWGGGLSATSWMLRQYEGLYNGYTNGATTTSGFTMDQRLKASFMLPGFNYPELAVTGGTYTKPYETNYTGDAAGLKGNGYNLAGIKKYVIGNIPGQTAKQNYPNDTYMLRLAEMYLIYAEASVLKDGGSSSDAKALGYFNTVHTRAGLLSVSTPLTWDIIFAERVKEFAMEGMAWYDLVRRHYYDAQHVYDIINSQERGLFLAQPSPWPNPTSWSFYKTNWFSTSDMVLAGPANFKMPIPQVELSQAPSLSDEPIPYTFN